MLAGPQQIRCDAMANRVEVLVLYRATPLVRLRAVAPLGLWSAV